MFTNPISQGKAPDPWVIYKEGYYYGCFTTEQDVRVWRSRNLEGIFRGESKSVWSGEADIWAPEIHLFNGKWYIYTTYNSGDCWMRTLILEATSADPLGDYVVKARLESLGNTIDASVWQDPSNGRIYMAYSRLDGTSGEGQEIWITEMENPYTPTGTSVLLSYPEYDWEKEYGAVNEGPQFLRKGDWLHIVYSASQCHYEGYKLGILTAEASGDLVDPRSWTKRAGPLFQKLEDAGVYGPGHHSMVKTPGGEWWNVYHAKDDCYKNTVNGPRIARMQPFTFDENDFPVFGKPVGIGLPLACPDSGGGVASVSLERPVSVPDRLEAPPPSTAPPTPE